MPPTNNNNNNAIIPQSSKSKRRSLITCLFITCVGYILFTITSSSSSFRAGNSTEQNNDNIINSHNGLPNLAQRRSSSTSSSLSSSSSSSSSSGSSSWFSYSSSSSSSNASADEDDEDTIEDGENNTDAHSANENENEDEETGVLEEEEPTHRHTNDDMVINIDSSNSSNDGSCDPNDQSACNHPKGVCQKSTNTCLCAKLWIGDNCEKPYPLKGKHIKAKIDRGLGFAGSITMSKKVTGKRKNIEVTLPGKEKDADKGHRILGPVDQELLSIMPQTDAVGEVYNKCAVVGSSGILLNYENGKFIDEHDAVFRFNSAPTKGGLEAHAGSKTTHRITNTQNWAFREGKELLLVHMRSHASLAAFLKTRKGDKSIRMAAFDQGFVEHMAHSLSFMPTSGLYGIIIALSRCHEVNLFGFQVSSEHGALYHYYDACDEPANGERDGAEWFVVKKLVEEKLVKFAEPCVVECHDSKTKCEQCKTEAGMPAVDLSKIRATSLQMRGKDLRRELTKQTYAERKKSCPACSKSFGGCRPPRHWAYARDRSSSSSSSRHGGHSHG
jgi:hypothetical protein